MTSTSHRDKADDLPPSCKFILHVLDQEGDWLTQAELVDKTNLPESTVSWALKRLKNQSKIHEATDSGDARANAYKIRVNGEL